MWQSSARSMQVLPQRYPFVHTGPSVTPAGPPAVSAETMTQYLGVVFLRSWSNGCSGAVSGLKQTSLIVNGAAECADDTGRVEPAFAAGGAQAQSIDSDSQIVHRMVPPSLTIVGTSALIHKTHHVTRPGRPTPDAVRPADIDLRQIEAVPVEGSGVVVVFYRGRFVGVIVKLDRDQREPLVEFEPAFELAWRRQIARAA